MKHVKSFAIVAALAAVMALGGASTAAAETTLCKVNETPCAVGNSYGVGTEVKLRLVSGTVFKFEMSGVGTVQCNKSETSGKVEKATTPEGATSVLTFAECNASVKVLKAGKRAIHSIAGTMNGNETATGVEVETELFGVKCLYGGTMSSGFTVIAGNPAKGIAKEAAIPKLGGSFLCPATAKLNAEYEVLAPKPLYISPGV
jgi:hypothetical protein